MKKTTIPESDIYRFEIAIPRGEDETWEDIEKQLTLKGRRLKLVEHLSCTLEREGWSGVTLKLLSRKPKKRNKYLGH